MRTDRITVGSHRLISLFFRGALRLRLPSTPKAPAWDLPLVLDALCLPPFEPLSQEELRWLSVKTKFLLAITSPKRVGEIHILSVSGSGLRWNSEQLFVRYGGPRRSTALSKQCLSHWIVDVIAHGYGTKGQSLPSGIGCHCTRSVSTSWAVLSRVSLENIQYMPRPHGHH